MSISGRSTLLPRFTVNHGTVGGEVYGSHVRRPLTIEEHRVVESSGNVLEYVTGWIQLVGLVVLVLGGLVPKLVSNALEGYLSVQSSRMNENMKTLTLMSTVMLPITFIAGVYGMNFEYMPELRSRWGYPASLGLMAVVVASAFGWFRHKGWIGSKNLVPPPRRIDLSLACLSAPWRPRANSKYGEYYLVRARPPRSRNPAPSIDHYVSGAALEVPASDEDSSVIDRPSLPTSR